MPTYNAYYRALNVVPDADPVVIEAAYKALMKKHHPDKHPAGPAAGERDAAELNRAWAVLRDPTRRAAYDAEERARQERHRVDLARAFPDAPPRGGPEPARRPALPNPRGGQRLAAVIGLAGIAVLVAAIVLMARGGGLDAKLVAAPPLVTEAASRLPGLPGFADELDEEAFRALPVNRQQVFTAVAEFKRISGRGGLPAAARFSEQCFTAQARSRGIGEFDYCVAFDHAAARTDLTPELSPDPRFAPQATMQRHIRAAADSLSRDTTIIEARLFEVRRLTDSALLDLSPRPIALTEVEAPAAVAAAPPAVRTPEPRARPQPPRPARPRGEAPQDFVEREGGIY